MKYEVIDIREISQDQLNLWFSQADAAAQNRLLRFRRRPDYVRSLCADHLARKMLAEALGCDPASISLGRTESGKPYLEHSPMEFNLSHSGNYAVCAIHTSPIGADLEVLRPIRPELCKRVCNEEEFSFIYAEGRFDSERFFRIWTAKEAFLKHQGRGISCNLQAVPVMGEGRLCYPTAQLFQTQEQDYVLSIAY